MIYLSNANLLIANKYLKLNTIIDKIIDIYIIKLIIRRYL